MKFLVLAPLLVPIASATAFAQLSACPDFSGRYRCQSLRPNEDFTKDLRVSQTHERLSLQDEFDGANAAVYDLEQASTNTIAPMGRVLEVKVVSQCHGDVFEVTSERIANISMGLVMTKTTEGFRYEIKDNTGRQYDDLFCRKQNSRADVLSP